MTHIQPSSRRGLLQASLASLGVCAIGLPLRASIAGADPIEPGPPVVPTLIATGVVPSAPAAVVAPNTPLAIAKAGLERVGDRIKARDIVGVADFGRSSAEPRLHLVDIASGKTTSLLVAHGRGSDPRHTGWLKTFSNVPNSDATSEGAYLTGDDYEGAHGRSMRLVGLDSTNSHAETRRIVVHSANYVGQLIARLQGMIGRSEGCFAVSDGDLRQVLARLGPGRLLIAARIEA